MIVIVNLYVKDNNFGTTGRRKDEKIMVRRKYKNISRLRERKVGFLS